MSPGKLFEPAPNGDFLVAEDEANDQTRVPKEALRDGISGRVYGSMGGVFCRFDVGAVVTILIFQQRLSLPSLVADLEAQPEETVKNGTD